jgi:hypothetical protein
MPDSISVANGFVWVAYHDNADSTGVNGIINHSTVVQYDPSGNVMATYALAGYVDGLKCDPYSGEIWALQNQDGNSTLTLITPGDNTPSAPIPYADPSMTRGYDDVVFTDGKVYMSYTNPPGTSGDPTLVQVLNGNNPHNVIHTKPILTDGVMGLNTATGTMQVAPQTDPDSLKLAPNGDLLFTSAADDVIIDVRNPGTPKQTIAFTQVLLPDNVPAGNLDDVIKPSTNAGTFYLTDTGTNQVLTVHVTGLNVNDYYASVGSAFGQVDPTTGDFTTLVTGSSLHGVEFVPDANADPNGNPQPAVSVNEHNDSFTFNPPAGSTAMNATTNTPQNDGQVQDALHPDHALAAALTQLLAEAPHSDPLGMAGTDALHQTHLDHGQHNFHLG